MNYIHLNTLAAMLAFYISCLGQTKAHLPQNSIKPDGKHITYEVPNGGVFEIKQDRRGNIWVATNKGVYRYDGKSFLNITSNVSYARFISVLEDRNGDFWFASLGSGVYYYDGKSFRNFTTRDGLVSNHIFCIYEDRDGNIWFGTNNGASRYNGKSFNQLKMKDVPATGGNDSVHVSAYHSGLREDSPLNNDIHTIIQDKTGKLWFGTRGNTFIYDGKTFTTFINKDGKALNNVWRIVEDKKGNIWFGADGLWRYNGSALTKINQTGSGVVVLDKKGNLLASSGGPIFRYNWRSLSDKEPHVTEIKTNDEDRKNLPFGILGADDGSIWFASKGGVSRYDGKTIKEFKSQVGQ